MIPVDLQSGAGLLAYRYAKGKPEYVKSKKAAPHICRDCFTSEYISERLARPRNLTFNMKTDGKFRYRVIKNMEGGETPGASRTNEPGFTSCEFHPVFEVCMVCRQCGRLLCRMCMEASVPCPSAVDGKTPHNPLIQSDAVRFMENRLNAAVRKIAGARASLNTKSYKRRMNDENAVQVQESQSDDGSPCETETAAVTTEPSLPKGPYVNVSHTVLTLRMRELYQLNMVVELEKAPNFRCILSVVTGLKLLEKPDSEKVKIKKIQGKEIMYPKPEICVTEDQKTMFEVSYNSNTIQMYSFGAGKVPRHVKAFCVGDYEVVSITVAKDGRIATIDPTEYIVFVLCPLGDIILKKIELSKFHTFPNLHRMYDVDKIAWGLGDNLYILYRAKDQKSSQLVRLIISPSDENHTIGFITTLEQSYRLFCTGPLVCVVHRRENAVILVDGKTGQKLNVVDCPGFPTGVTLRRWTNTDGDMEVVWVDVLSRVVKLYENHPPVSVGHVAPTAHPVRNLSPIASNTFKVREQL